MKSFVRVINSAILLKMTAHIDSQKLKTIINEKDWDQLLQNVKPKHFVRQESEYVCNNVYKLSVDR